MQNNVPEIGKEYVGFMQHEIKNIKPDIILYGSTVYGKVSSDLDISFIVKDYNQKEYERIRDLTIDFQKKHHMDLDEEVPYSSKLIYTHRDVEHMLNNSPFRVENGVYRITPIVKTKEFLGSKEMKYRLLLNILTTRSLTIEGDSIRIDEYRQRAWDLLVKVIVSYNKLTEIDLDEFIQLLQQDKKTKNEGEMFLGYKTNIHQKQLDLEEDCEKTLYRMTKEGKLSQQSSRKFKINEDLER